MIIRPAQPGDGLAIHGLIQGLALYEELAEHCISTPEDYERDLFCENPVIRVLLAEIDGQAVGFALFFRSYSTFLGRSGIFLEDIFVNETDRSRGIGKALLSAVAQVAVDEGAGRLEWSVLDWNELAIGFYRKLGAKLMDGWTTCRLEGDEIRAVAQLP